MGFSVVLSAVMIMGVIILFGALLRHNLQFTKEAQQLLIKIIVNVGMPAIILSSIFNFEIDERTASLILTVLLFSIALHTLSIFGIALFLRPRLNHLGRANELSLLSILGNTGFIGIPLAYTLFGAEGALLAAIFDAGLDLVLWTIGVTFLQPSGKVDLRALKAMINLPMLAIVVGLTLGFMHFEAPPFLKELTERLANLASPLAMLYIGLLIPPMWERRAEINPKELGFALGVKLILLPLVVAIGTLLLPFEKELRSLLVMLASMPSFALASVLFGRFNADARFGTAVVISSTLLSLVTIPLLLTLLV